LKFPFVAMLIILIIGISGYISVKRSSIYAYDVRQDYVYSLDEIDAEHVDLVLKDGKITLDTPDDSYRTALLKISIDTGILGKYIQPSINISSGKSSITQYFERGAEGVRYLNISSLLPDIEDEIYLKGDYVLFDDQSVRLYLIKNRDIKKSRILVLAPHPDDAEIAAYGLYSSNKDSHVVTVTAGDAGVKIYNEIYWNHEQHFHKKGELRTWNSIVVPLLAGLSPEHVLNLGFFDGTLKSMFEERPAAATGRFTHATDINTYRKQNISGLGAGLHGGADWDSLVSNLKYLLAEIKPDIVVAPYPALDVHTDHKYTSVALFEAIRDTGIKDGQLYLYTNHLVLSESYPYGEMGGVVSLPPNPGEDIYFSSIYSHALSEDVQKDKIFAMEAMNDLRPDTEWRFYKGIIKMALSKITADLMGEDISYFRRAVRSNELFIVVDFKDIYDDKVVDRLVGEGAGVTYNTQ